MSEGADSSALVAQYSPTEGEAGWLRALRDDAIARFEAIGFPTSHLEDWKYTAAPARAIAKGRFAPVSSAPQISGPAESLASVLAEDAVSLDGKIGSIAQAKDDAFVALNTAFFSDGAVVRVPRGEVITEPIHIVFEAQAAMTAPRVWIEAEPNSSATIVIEFASATNETSFSSSVFEANLGANAELQLVVLQREHDAALHVSRGFVRQERDSRFTAHTVTLGGKLVRNDIEVVLAEEGANATLNGLFLGTASRHVDNHTLVDHAVPHGTSHEMYKGILGETSRGVFRGRVIVRPDAQKTSAEQHNANILLGNKAEIDTKPQLEIYADDVRCSHGSTIGQLDTDALFYLRARGISKDDAYLLLVEGFANEIFDEIRDVSIAGKSLSERIRALFLDSLSGLAAVGGGG
ncbi:MAG: Fe-S cluster assembly protein SufD [Myxococcota bacterium]|nr:Fe-S cluster assembly protein SufD [Myxococcota bacterium]